MHKTKAILKGLSLTSLLLLTLAAVQADTILYDNGPIYNGDASRTINRVYAVTDSFSLASAATLASINFGAQVVNGDTFSSLDWSITTAPFGGTILASGSSAISSSTFVSPFNSSWSNYLDSFSITPTNLAAGNYWLQLDNASSALGDMIGWNVSYGGTSTAFQSTTYHGTTVASVPSNAFQISGLSSAPGAPAPPMTACLAFAAVLVLQAFRRRKAAE